MSTTPTVNVDFVGNVSAEVAAGENVVVSVTNPDGTINSQTASGPTVDDGQGTPTSISFKTNQITIPAGTGYKAQATILGDAEYAGAQSDVTPFDALKSRTVSVGKVEVS